MVFFKIIRYTPEPSYKICKYIELYKQDSICRSNCNLTIQQKVGNHKKDIATVDARNMSSFMKYLTNVKKGQP